jgi:virginiamycin B lyase
MKRAFCAALLAGVSLVLAACSGSHNGSTGIPSVHPDSNVRHVKSVGDTTSYSVPTAGANLSALAVGPDGNIWFTEANATASSAGKIGKITTSGTITEYQLPYTPPVRRIDPGIYFNPTGITAGSDGKMWFIASNSAYVGSITTDGSTISFYSLDGTTQYGTAAYKGITTGSDGNLWVTDDMASKVLAVTTSGTVSRSVALASNCGPGMIVAGPDSKLWVVERSTDAIAKITTGGTLTEYALGLNNYFPYALVSAGTKLRFTAVNSSAGTALLGTLTTSGSSTVFSIQYAGVTGRISLATTGGSSGLSWTLDSGIASYPATGGFATSYSVPSANPAVGTDGATGFIFGPDGKLWYADRNQNNIVTFSTT